MQKTHRQNFRMSRTRYHSDFSGASQNRQKVCNYSQYESMMLQCLSSDLCQRVPLCSVRGRMVSNRYGFVR